MEKQAENLINITSRYECDKKYWAAAVSDLQEKVKVNDEILFGSRIEIIFIFFFSFVKVSFLPCILMTNVYADDEEGTFSTFV